MQINCFTGHCLVVTQVSGLAGGQSVFRDAAAVQRCTVYIYIYIHVYLYIYNSYMI